MESLGCFVCGQPVVGLLGQDDDWNTTLLHPDRAQDQRVLDANAFGPCHLLCLTRSEWGRFWSQSYREQRGQDPDAVHFEGWHFLTGGDWTTTLLNENGWRATLTHQAIRLAEPYAGGVRMLVISPQWLRLQNYPAALGVVQTAFATQSFCALSALLDALGALPFVSEPLALDRAGLWPAPAQMPMTSNRALPVALCYDVWLPAGLYAPLRACVPDVPPDQDRLWQALEAALLPELARESLSVPSAASVLGRGVSPEIADEQGRLPMQFAATQADVELARLLLACGADINHQNSVTGGTALHAAAAQDSRAMVTWLLAQGADPTVVDDEGETPLDTAEFAGDDAAAVLSQYRKAE